MNERTKAYYRITEEAYRALAPEGTEHMNLGLWPAGSLVAAQQRLVLETLAYHQSHAASLGLSAPDLVIEGGSGFGAARDAVSEIFPASSYLGINASDTQVSYARARNASVAHTSYVEMFLEDWAARRDEILLPGGVRASCLFFAVEAVLHVIQKPAFFIELANAGVDRLALAEITLEDPTAVGANSLFQPSLSYTAPSSAYYEALADAGYTKIVVTDLSTQVFEPWAAYLEQLDEPSFRASKRVLRQFKASYRALAELAATGKARYLLISACRIAKALS